MNKNISINNHPPKGHPSHERTLTIIKPDGIERSLIGEIVGRYERIGLKLVGAKMIVPTVELIKKHYTLEPEWLRKVGEKQIKGYLDKGLKSPHSDPMIIAQIVLKNLIKYMTSGPVLALVWQGAHAVEIVRKLTGSTEPLMSDVGTIRGDYVLDSYQMSDHDGRSIRNLVHASGSVKEAKDEIAHWFRKEEIIDYHMVGEHIVYDVDMEGIF